MSRPDGVHSCRLWIRSYGEWIPFEQVPVMSRPASTPTFWLLFCASTLENAAFNGSSPVIARFVTESFGAGPAAAGMLAALAPLSSLIFQPLAGHAADRFGYRRIGILGALAGCCGFLLTLLTTIGPPLFAVAALGRLLIGGGGAGLGTITTAWVVATTPREVRGQALSIYGLSVWIAFAVGPVIGENVYQNEGFPAVWVIFSGLLLLTTGCVALSVEPVGGAPAGHMTMSGLGAAIRLVSRPGAVAAAAWAGQAVLSTYLVELLAGRGLPPDGIVGAATLYPVFAACLIGSRLLFGKIADTVPPRRIAVGGLLGITVGLLVIAGSDSFWSAAFGAALLGFVYAPMYPALTLLATDPLPAEHRAMGLGVFSSFTSLGLAIGPLIGGLVATWWGLGWVFAVAAGIALIALPALPRDRGPGDTSGSDGSDESRATGEPGQLGPPDDPVPPTSAAVG